jgi:hypothetical protein
MEQQVAFFFLEIGQQVQQQATKKRADWAHLTVPLLVTTNVPRRAHSITQFADVKRKKINYFGRS